MAIEAPSIVISTTAPDHAQHLTTDLNDAFGRLARSTSAEIAALDLVVADADYGDITVSSSGTVWTIDNDAITNPKLGNMAEGAVKGRVSTGTGDPEDIARGQLPATATNDSASAGRIGEYISSIIQSGSAVALADSVAANITSISLTAGDWDVWVNTTFTGSGTGVTLLFASISATSATNDSNVPNFGAVPTFGGVSIGTGNACVAGPARISLAGTTTYFFVAQSNFTGGAVSAYGSIQARRRR